MKRYLISLILAILVISIAFCAEKSEPIEDPFPAVSENASQGKPFLPDAPFVDDPEVIGEWKSVDLVDDVAGFNPDVRRWPADLYLKEMVFKPQGKTFKPFWTWGKNVIFHLGDKTASRYEIIEIAGEKYLFFEWITPDVTVKGRKPCYYVLKKTT